MIYCADLFCGSGGSSTGLMQAAEELGLGVSLVAVNHWQTAIETHTTNHPGVTHYCEDLETVNPRKAVPGGHLHLLVASPECFPAGTLVLTDSGFLPIEDVRIGMEVWTHQGRWRPVTETMRAVKDTVVVAGHGHFGLETTREHPFYTRKKNRIWNNSRRAWEFQYAEPEWVPASETNGLLWATPTTCEALPIPHPPHPFAATRDFWWMVGRWLGDGSGGVRAGKGGEINICCGHHDADELRARLQSMIPLGINLRESVKRTATSFDFCHMEFAAWITRYFGRLAHGKTLPAWALTMPKAWRSSLLTGYLSADGHFDGRKQEATTVSRSLAISLRLLAEGLGFRTALHTAPQHCNVIEGRTVNVRDVYRVMWVAEPKREYSREIDGLAWSRISSVREGRKDVTVYNLSVAEDESYLADGIVVHNCTHHSNARGGKPMSDQSRASAWHVLRWVEALYVENVLIENVREWRDWGPLYPKGHEKEFRPIPEKKGEFYRLFLHNLRKLGYTVSERLLNAADYGDATTRQRLFIQARRKDLGGRIKWPSPTHIKPPPASALPGLMDGIPTWKPARDIIEWSLPSQSIYSRKKPLAPATMARIMAGLRKYSGLPFLVPNLSEREGQAPRTHDLEQPLPTVTTFGGGNLVEPFLIGAGGPSGAGEPQSVGEPLGTVLTENHRALVQPFVIGQQSCAAPRSTDDPVPTIATAGAISLVQPYLVVLRANADGRPVSEPVPTLTTGGNMALAEPFIVPTTHGGGPERTHDVGQPLPTVTAAHRGEMALAEPFLMVFRENQGARSLDKPAPTITTDGGFGLCEPFITQMEHSTEGHERRCYDMERPVPTITGKGMFGLCEPFLSKFHGSHAGQSDGDRRNLPLDAPLPTLDTSNRVGLAEPFLVSYYGQGGPASVDEPLDTITSRDRFALVDPQLVTDGLLDKGAIVGWLDIRFRMLQPCELAAAMSFPPDYQFAGNREAQVKQIGNSVAVQTAKALCLEILKGVRK